VLPSNLKKQRGSTKKNLLKKNAGQRKGDLYTLAGCKGRREGVIRGKNMKGRRTTQFQGEQRVGRAICRAYKKELNRSP